MPWAEDAQRSFDLGLAQMLPRCSSMLSPERVAAGPPNIAFSLYRPAPFGTVTGVPDPIEDVVGGEALGLGPLDEFGDREGIRGTAPPNKELYALLLELALYVLQRIHRSIDSPVRYALGPLMQPPSLPVSL